MTRPLVPPPVRACLPELTIGALGLVSVDAQIWLVIRSDASEYFGAQPIDLRSELACYDTGAVLDLQLWLAGALVQPVVYQAWLDPHSPDDRLVLTLLAAQETVEIAFFDLQSDHLRFAKSYMVPEPIRQRLLELQASGRAHTESLKAPFWLAAKNEHLRR